MLRWSKKVKVYPVELRSMCSTGLRLRLRLRIRIMEKGERRKSLGGSGTLDTGRAGTQALTLFAA
jgi:hypothetical protein